MTNLVAVTQRVDTIVKVLRRKPLKRFSTAELSAATGLDRTVLTSNMKTWMTKNVGDMVHVHLEAVRGHAHYYYDPDHERTGAPAGIRKTNKRSKTLVVANTDSNGVVRVKRSPRVGHVLAKVAFDEGGLVVAVTEDGRVLRGRWLS